MTAAISIRNLLYIRLDRRGMKFGSNFILDSVGLLFVSKFGV